MNDEIGFKTICSVDLPSGGSVSMSFPLPAHLELLELSRKNNERAIEYYLLARYAFVHQMHSAFMINAFWAAEHLMLALLRLKYSKEELGKLGDWHELPKYWQAAKEMVGGEKASSMSKFDDYIGKVKGYFQERYPITDERGKLHHTNKSVRVVMGDNPEAKAAKFGKVYRLELDELDHFVNFMLHDITSIGTTDISHDLMFTLESQKNTQLYLINNQYSVVHPNKAYHGEQSEK